MGATPHFIPAFSPGEFSGSPDHIRCQHAELSHVCSAGPTHTSAAAHRKFFLKTKLYDGDKRNFLGTRSEDTRVRRDAHHKRAKAHVQRGIARSANNRKFTI
jgi:hypothetical protein